MRTTHKTKFLQVNAGPLAGVQSQERTMSALPVRIDYQYPQRDYSCIATGNDFRFSPVYNFETPPTVEEHDKHIQTVMRTRGHNLDPYAVRDAFVAVEDPTAALRFLSEAGIFWPFQQILWSEFQEWQSFFGWLRLSPEHAMLSPEGEKAWRTAEGFQNEFFTETLRFSPDAIKEIGPEEMRKIEVRDRHMLRELRHFAIRPERISIEWREVGDKSFRHCPPQKKFRGKDQTPFLKIEAHNIVEAIAATIYADRCDGMVYQACKRCGKLFKVDSQHGREFCPPTRLDIKTSPCKNAYLAQARRDRIRDEQNTLRVKRKRRASVS